MIRHTLHGIIGGIAVLATGCASSGSLPRGQQTFHASVAAAPASMSFDTVVVGSSGSRSLTLTNTGNSGVTVSAVNVSDSALSVHGLTLPNVIAAGASTTASITFAPQVAMTLTGSVSFVSNATNSPAVVAVSGSGVTPIPHSVDLSWIASSSTVAGYNVYRSTQPGSGYQLINTSLVTGTTYTDSTVQSGQTYFYVVTALDANNTESAFSNQASAPIPIP